MSTHKEYIKTQQEIIQSLKTRIEYYKTFVGIVLTVHNLELNHEREGTQESKEIYLNTRKALIDCAKGIEDI